MDNEERLAGVVSSSSRLLLLSHQNRAPMYIPSIGVCFHVGAKGSIVRPTAGVCPTTSIVTPRALL